MRRRVLLCARSILLGWVALLVLIYLPQRPLLVWAGRWLGAEWFPTVRLALNCAALAAAGWIAGRWYRPVPWYCLGALALTLCFHDFGPEMALDVPWLIRLAGDTLRDSLYLESFATTLATHILLFGSLFAGGVRSRPSEMPASITGGPPG